jgi:C-terminal processing protease CtpA/Prc
MVTIPEILEAQHLVADASRVPMELKDADGRSIELELSAIPRQPLELLDAGPEPEARPLYRRRPDENYWLVLLEPSQVLYVQYRRASDGGAESFSQFAARIIQMLDSEPVRALVLDLRNNTGGNSGLMEPLLVSLERRPEWSSGEGLYTIIGRATFSSALMNAFDLKARTRAILVGEETGGKPNHYGQVSSFNLPTSGIRVFHSTRFFRLSATSDPSSLSPDVPVEIRSRDYFEGRDPVLETVLSFLGGS